jgi:SAM-dependent methyltransferase
MSSMERVVTATNHPGQGTDAGDYVLGTHDVEVARLGLQHRVWREAALAGWRRAGLREGMRVLDVGAGPGWATVDLAELVGPGGHVLAVERSPRFLEHLRAIVRQRPLPNVTVVESDLMTPPAASGYDLAWCRWVASFVADPATLVRWLAAALRPGGRVVFHEYAAYETWRYLPPRPALEEFRRTVVATWRADGGEPDVAGPLTALLATHGLHVEAVRPLVFTAAPGEPMWRWPAAFVESYLERLVALGHRDAAWAARVARELHDAEADPASRVLTPIVAEIIAVRS